MVADRQPDAPFVHVFHHRGRSYVLDVPSGALMEVDPVLAAVLPGFDPVQPETAVERWRDVFDEKTVRATLAEIARARDEEGIFRGPQLDVRPDPVHRKDYETRLRQLTLTLTERCNLRCRYCLFESDRPGIRPHRNRTMPLETALAALRFFVARCEDTAEPVVSFYGGEPLLCFPLMRKLVAEARGHDDWPVLRFVIDTNGTLLTDAVVDWIATNGIDLQISLDGPAPVHDHHRVTGGGGSTHAAVESAVGRLLDRDPTYADRLTFQATLAPPFDLNAVVEYFAAFPPFVARGIERAPGVRINLADVDGFGPGLECHPDRTVERWTRQAAVQRDEYVAAHLAGEREQLGAGTRALFDGGLIKLFHRPRDPMPGRLRPGASCRPGLRRLHVKPDGTFQPCERVGEDFPIGHVEDGFDFGAIGRLEERFSAALGRRCRQCWALRLCGVCFGAMAEGARVGDNAGSPGAPIPESVCAGVRRQREEELKLYVELGGDTAAALDFLSDTPAD